MNKKAFLLAEETLKIVIALISISFLIYFLSALYFTNKASKDLEFAEASLQHLIDEINLGSIEVEIYNPEGWVISSWPHKVLKGIIGFREEVNDIPNSCSNLGWKSCICFCGDTSILNLEGEDCDKKGICLESEYGIEGNVIELEDIPLNLLVAQENQKITEK